MDTIEWTDELSVNNNTLDAHHKKLIQLINRAVELYEKDYGGKQFIEVITNSLKYARHHFDAEEKYMESIDYPDFLSHQQVHLQFIQDITILYVDIKNNNPNAPEKICAFLKEWFVQHLLNEDQKYCRYQLGVISSSGSPNS